MSFLLAHGAKGYEHTNVIEFASCMACATWVGMPGGSGACGFPLYTVVPAKSAQSSSAPTIHTPLVSGLQTVPIERQRRRVHAG